MKQCDASSSDEYLRAEFDKYSASLIAFVAENLATHQILNDPSTRKQNAFCNTQTNHTVMNEEQIFTNFDSFRFEHEISPSKFAEETGQRYHPWRLSLGSLKNQTRQADLSMQNLAVTIFTTKFSNFGNEWGSKVANELLQLNEDLTEMNEDSVCRFIGLMFQSISKGSAEIEAELLQQSIPLRGQESEFGECTVATHEGKKWLTTSSLSTVIQWYIFCAKQNFTPSIVVHSTIIQLVKIPMAIAGRVLNKHLSQDGLTEHEKTPIEGPYLVSSGLGAATANYIFLDPNTEVKTVCRIRLAGPNEQTLSGNLFHSAGAGPGSTTDSKQPNPESCIDSQRLRYTMCCSGSDSLFGFCAQEDQLYPLRVCDTLLEYLLFQISLLHELRKNGNDQMMFSKWTVKELQLMKCRPDLFPNPDDSDLIQKLIDVITFNQHRNRMEMAAPIAATPPAAPAAAQ